MTKPEPTDFERAASEEPESSLPREFWQFLRDSKKWWLLPIVLILGLMGGLILLSGTAAAPFIYPWF